ncbi:hypothetical protein SAMN05421505_10467 [Sinosporangium album]|uniref:Uncharacterized protein n=1 Tax=Sinosporangium album TaxID=504805 RepID=A0A1G7U2K3_9ACTN|nr:hypothetical protein SAMN05421505_10467 [Sinosporangium album]
MTSHNPALRIAVFNQTFLHFHGPLGAKLPLGAVRSSDHVVASQVVRGAVMCMGELRLGCFSARDSVGHHGTHPDMRNPPAPWPAAA